MVYQRFTRTKTKQFIIFFIEAVLEIRARVMGFIRQMSFGFRLLLYFRFCILVL